MVKAIWLWVLEAGFSYEGASEAAVFLDEASARAAYDVKVAECMSNGAREDYVRVVGPFEAGKTFVMCGDRTVACWER